MITLLLWTVLATNRQNTYSGWQPLMKFDTTESCHRAAKNLVIDPKLYRCMKPTGEV